MIRLPLLPIVETLEDAGLAAEAIRLALKLSGTTWQARHTWTVNVWWADRAAIRLGFHPAEIWGVEAWLHAATYRAA